MDVTVAKKRHVSAKTEFFLTREFHKNSVKRKLGNRSTVSKKLHTNIFSLFIQFSLRCVTDK